MESSWSVRVLIEGSWGYIGDVFGAWDWGLQEWQIKQIKWKSYRVEGFGGCGVSSVLWVSRVQGL